MKTVLLVKSDYDRIGGPETLLRSLAATFDLERCTPVLVLLRRPGTPPACTYPQRIAQMPLPWRGVGGLLGTAWALARLARELRADVVNTHDMRANAVAVAMRLFHRLPWIANVHGWLGSTHHGRWKLFEAIDRRLVRLADQVIVGSAAARAEVAAAGAREVVVIPNAVAVPALEGIEDGRDELRSGLGLRPDTVVIGILGRLHPGKGHYVLLRALARIARQDLVVPVHVLVVGEGPAGAALGALAAALEVASLVTFTGYVDDAARYLAVMDIVAVPSLKDSLPLTALEAMAHGRAVVGSAAGDLPVAIKDGTTGFIVPIGDDAALAERLVRLALDPVLRRGMGEAARQRVLSTYSDVAMARRFEAQYDAVCGSAVRDGTAHAP